MRQLIVIRHAKSDWHHPELADHDRPLNKRGLRDAPGMGQRLYKQCSTPDALICSSAVRARTTASLMAGPLAYNEARIIVEKRLYGASAASLLKFIQELPNQHHRVAIIAHNPGVTDLVNILSGQQIENMPTCSYAVMNFAVDDWQLVTSGIADLTGFDYPKKPQ